MNQRNANKCCENNPIPFKPYLKIPTKEASNPKRGWLINKLNMVKLDHVILFTIKESIKEKAPDGVLWNDWCFME